MKTDQSKTERDKAERAAYVAIDAIIRVQDMGYGSAETEHALSHLRNVLRSIGQIPIRLR